MDGFEFDKLCRQIRRDNRKLLNRLMSDPKISWMYVNKGGRVYGSGEGLTTPSAYQTREGAKWMDTPLFLITRSNLQYCDVSYFTRGEHKRKIGEILDRPDDDFFDYQQPGDGIVTINAQSGLINKLTEAGFAVGKLKVLKPKIDEQRYSCGATIADVQNVHYILSGKVLHIASQNADEVHKRGSRVRGERPNEEGTIERIERVHRFDDPVVDIIITYEMKSGGCNPLVLFGPRQIYDRKLDREFWPKVPDHPTSPNS